MQDNQKTRVASLLDYEKQIIYLICEAKPDADIAYAMGMELKDFQYCKKLIFEKTGSQNWAELVIYAIKERIFKIRF